MASPTISPAPSGEPSEAAKACAVCSEQAREVLYRSKHSVLIWGAGSAGSATKVGHVMVCPARHAAEMGDLDPAEIEDLLRCCSLAARSAYSAWYTGSSWNVDQVTKASYNLGFNHGPHGTDLIGGGKAAGHLHVHVVPRNPNDSNFMWWTTQASILHLKDLGMRERLIQELERRTATAEGDAAPRKTAGKSKNGRIAVNGSATKGVELATSGSAEGSSSAFEPDFEADEPKAKACPLCKETGDLMETDLARVLFSVKPYKAGHVMVIPKRHVGTIERFTPEELVEVARVVALAAKLACKATGTDSYSVGVNVGPHSGASIPSHCHIHVVPRFPLDSSVGYWAEAKTSLRTLYAPPKVRDVFEEYVRLHEKSSVGECLGM